MTTPTSASLGDEKTVAVTTFRKNGDPVTTPVWPHPVSNGRLGFWTAMGSGKTKRLKNDPRVTLQPCSSSGKLRPGTTPVSGVAEMIQSGPLFDEVQTKGREKYGVMVTVSRLMGQLFGQRRKGQTYGDTVVLVTLDKPA